MRTPLLTLLLLAIGGCTSDPADPAIDAIQIGETWVFAWQEAPGSSMDALESGTAAQVDGCLQVGDSVVVWWPEQLDQVEEFVLAVEAGAAPELQVGGGGSSLEEGATLEDFPDVVLEHCTPTVLWWSGGGEVTVSDGG